MRHTNPTPEQERLWKEWLDKPEHAKIRAAAERLDPWTLYRLKTTGQRVYLLAFTDPGGDGKVTCRVGVSGEYNLVTFERDVFGVDPDNLEECDLPGPGEVVGTFDLPDNLVVNLRNSYPEGIPRHVALDLIARYPIKRGGQQR